MGAVQSYVSVSRRPPDVEDYIDMLRRHRSWIIGPTYLGLVAAVVVAFVWPDTFESTAVMRITPQLVSEQIMPATLNLEMSQRLDALRTKILSRTFLTTLISSDKLKLYPNLVRNYTMEDAIAKMQKDVRIDPYGSSGTAERRYATAFLIRFSYPDKYKAQMVVQNLVTEFVNQNISVQNDSARQTQDFVASELKDAKDKLDAIQTNIFKFQQQYAGSLPENAAGNIQLKSALDMRLSQETDHLNGLQLTKNNLLQELQGRNDMLPILSQGMDESTPAQTIKNQSLINLDAALRNEEAVLAGMRRKLRDNMPEVRDQKAKVETLRQQRDQEQEKLEEQQQAAPPSNPMKGRSLSQQASLTNYQNTINALKMQINNTDVLIENASRSRVNLEKQIQAVSARIEAGAAVSMEYNRLEQDALLAKATYDDLTKRETLSATAKDLQERHVGEQLEVLDPASLPPNPTDPNRFVITGVGVVMGLMVGLVLAGAKEARDTSLKNLKDVRAYTNLPVLSSIPLLENALLVRRKRRLFWLAWSAAVIVGSTAMFLAMTYYFAPHTQ